jgi:hypothetical protein
MKGRGLSNSTIARRMHALKSFWRLLLDIDVVKDERLRKLGIPKRERKLPVYLCMNCERFSIPPNHIPIRSWLRETMPSWLSPCTRG